MGQSVYSYTWNSLGPQDINANRFCFGVGLPYWVICVDDGMYLYNYSTHTCDFYTNGGLPIWGATHYSADKMMVIMGDGSWSDGIYTFDFNTHQFEVLTWKLWPNFLIFDDYNNIFWAGFQFGGLMKSSDGLNWEEVSALSEKSIACMDVYGENIVVSEVSNVYGIYYSPDGGENWSQSVVSPLITDLKFDGWGKLCGIFPDYSNSSGLWQSEDFGETWEVVFYHDNMSAIGFDAFGETFVGWHGDGGIAHFDIQAPPPGLTFLNEGLSNLNINRIQLNPTMSAPAIFVSTEGGAYYSYDYMVGVDEFEKQNPHVLLSPNPVIDKLVIESDCELISVEILSLSGSLAGKYLLGNTVNILDVSQLSRGIYLLNFDTENGNITKKIVVK